jgi:hypothetical protein
VNKDVAELWVKELRSGKYEQTKHALQKENAFCCLGVLCKIGEANDVKVRKRTNGRLYGGDLGSQKYITNWSGLSSPNGLFTGGLLAKLNDDNFNFNQLADVIEEKWKEL